MDSTDKRILAVFAHPDDETTTSGGTLARYATEGAKVFVATATRGEQGGLGTGGYEILRDDLPAVRQVGKQPGTGVLLRQGHGPEGADEPEDLTAHGAEHLADDPAGFW